MAAAGAVLGIASTLYGASESAKADATQAEAVKRQSAYAKTIYDVNAANAERSAEDAVRVGDVEATRLQQGAGLTLGAQKVARGASGVQLGSGSAADAADDVTMMAGIDAATIRENAWNRALGIKASAQNERMQGVFAQMTGEAQSRALRSRAGTTLATGGLAAASRLADYKRTGY